MTTTIWRVLMLVGAAIVAVGLYLGLAKVTAPAINGLEDCGSVLHPSSYATDGTGSAIVAECDRKRNDRHQVVWALLIGGGIVAVGSGLAATAAGLAPDQVRREE